MSSFLLILLLSVLQLQLKGTSAVKRDHSVDCNESYVRSYDEINGQGTKLKDALYAQRQFIEISDNGVSDYGHD